MKAIVIREPYASLILAGEKTWEMRKATCRYRGPVALISKGSGTVVGTAEIVDSLPSFDSLEAYAQAEPKHRVPPPLQRQAFSAGWRTPWVLTNGRRLTKPVPYKHPSGAVVWINLSDDVIAEVMAQLGRGAMASEPSEANRVLDAVELSPRDLRAAQPHSVGSNKACGLAQQVPKEDCSERHVLSGLTRNVTVTGGNIRNNHIYLPLEFFPEEAMGGDNKLEPADRTIVVTFSPGGIIQTDIDRTKRILRARAPVGDFFRRAGVSEGDTLRITNTSPYCYEISKEANG